MLVNKALTAENEEPPARLVDSFFCEKSLRNIESEKIKRTARRIAALKVLLYIPIFNRLDQSYIQKITHTFRKFTLSDIDAKKTIHTRCIVF